jgi:hypothetical protein
MDGYISTNTHAETNTRMQIKFGWLIKVTNKQITLIDTHVSTMYHITHSYTCTHY